MIRARVNFSRGIGPQHRMLLLSLPARMYSTIRSRWPLLDWHLRVATEQQRTEPGEPCPLSDAVPLRDGALAVCVSFVRGRYSVPYMIPRRTILLLPTLIAGLCLAQRSPRLRPMDQSGTPGSGHFVRIEGGLVVNEDEIRTAREVGSHSTGTPNWTNAPGFEADVFTFTRLIFHNDSGPGFGRARFRWLGWWVDYPDADLNFSYRLQQLTSIKTDPDARVIKLTDPTLRNYPLLYMEHAGYMHLSDDEIIALRGFLQNGGALFVNDFWGLEEWNGFASEVKRVLPHRTWTELTTEHPLFNCLYHIAGPMNRLQVPTVQFWNQDYDPSDPQSELQTIFRGEGSKEVHIQALFDERKRMMILAIHNSDVSDGWEREGENERYFREYSERIAYPLGFNIIFYLMTH
jgi:hypothetical protein